MKNKQSVGFNKLLEISNIPVFYPLNCIVVDKKRLFYPLQRIYWIKSCIFAIVNVQYTSKYE